jgi:hypothetical protein
VAGVLALLVAARGLISAESGWTQVHLATAGKGGAPVKPDSVSATCFCSTGALCKAAGVDDPMKSLEVFEALAELGTTVGETFAAFNDLQPHGKVLAAWDETILRVAKGAPGPGKG